MTRSFRRAIFLVAAALCSATASAQAFERPIKVIVGFPAGGNLDIKARIVADRLRLQLGQPVVVENRPGAGSLIAAEAVSRADPDGTTLLLAPVVVTAFFPFIYPKLNFDPMKDLTPVAMLGYFQFALAVNRDLPAQDLAQFIRYNKANPDKVAYASLSAGTPAHFLGVMFNRAAGTNMLHVPYKGGAPAMAALQSGEVQAAFATTGSVAELHKAGRVRALAVTGAARSPQLPDVPTFAEVQLGLQAMQDASLWYGYLAPGKTPPAIVKRLNSAISAVLKEPDVRQKVTHLDIQVADLSVEEFADVVRRDYETWGAVIRSTGFTVQEK
jgi:tripartite-type tricarboxylate transporter receptor subunit TctC